VRRRCIGGHEEVSILLFFFLAVWAEEQASVLQVTHMLASWSCFRPATFRWQAAKKLKNIDMRVKKSFCVTLRICRLPVAHTLSGCRGGGGGGVSQLDEYHSAILWESNGVEHRIPLLYIKVGHHSSTRTCDTRA
jgi:hypothetical protein